MNLIGKGHLLDTEVGKLHDNARPHVARATQKTLELGMGHSPACGIFTRLGPIRLSLVPVNAARLSG